MGQHTYIHYNRVIPSVEIINKSNETYEKSKKSYAEFLLTRKLSIFKTEDVIEIIKEYAKEYDKLIDYYDTYSIFELFGYKPIVDYSIHLYIYFLNNSNSRNNFNNLEDYVNNLIKYYINNRGKIDKEIELENIYILNEWKDINDIVNNIVPTPLEYYLDGYEDFDKESDYALNGIGYKNEVYWSDIRIHGRIDEHGDDIMETREHFERVLYNPNSEYSISVQKKDSNELIWNKDNFELYKELVEIELNKIYSKYPDGTIFIC